MFEFSIQLTICQKCVGKSKKVNSESALIQPFGKRPRKFLKKWLLKMSIKIVNNYYIKNPITELFVLPVWTVSVQI